MARNSSDVVWALVENMMAGEAEAATVIADAIDEGVDAGATIFTRIRKRDSVRFGKKHEGETEKTAFAAVTPGRSIVLFGTKDGRWDATKRDYVLVPYCRRFAVGDVAEYDSYNLSYTGRIVTITAKRIAIGTGWSRGGSSRVTESDPEKTKSLDLYQFNWRNYDFDEAETARRNAETSLHI